tara:strand:+ start:339 stop:503 length:165 start_codon:yes stop_codon:yes gene_type:complete
MPKTKDVAIGCFRRMIKGVKILQNNNANKNQVTGNALVSGMCDITVGKKIGIGY